MPKFIFAYHGGDMPETPEDSERVMAAWTDWMNSIEAAIVDPGNPVGMSKTVTANGVADNGGANPLTGYTIVNASSIDEACEFANGCPILSETNGAIEVAEIINVE